MRISDWSSDVCSSDLSADNAEGSIVVKTSRKTALLKIGPVANRNVAASGKRRIQVQISKLSPTGIFSAELLTSARAVVVFAKALPDCIGAEPRRWLEGDRGDRKSTRLNSSH